jgi:hypothetical protein
MVYFISKERLLMNLIQQLERFYTIKGYVLPLYIAWIFPLTPSIQANPKSSIGFGIGNTIITADMNKNAYGPARAKEYYQYQGIHSESPTRLFFMLDYLPYLSLGIEFQNWSKLEYQESRINQSTGKQTGFERSQYQIQLVNIRSDWRCFCLEKQIPNLYAGIQLGFALGKGRVIDKIYQLLSNESYSLQERHSQSFSIFQPQAGLLLGWENTDFRIQFDMLPLNFKHPNEKERLTLWSVYINAAYRF